MLNDLVIDQEVYKEVEDFANYLSRKRQSPVIKWLKIYSGLLITIAVLAILLLGKWLEKKGY